MAVTHQHSTDTAIFCNHNDYDNYIIASLLPPSSRVNLALAYTELTEELGRLQALSSKQTEILRKASQEQASPGQHGQYQCVKECGRPGSRWKYLVPLLK